jgi:LacI family transcriptional regulator
LIREQAHRPLAVKELLAHTPFSRGTLEQRFEKYLGHSLHDEIVQAHMERAQRLLRETLLPVTKVAAQSGYASYAVFSVAFRKHTGMTALAYRQREVTAEGI